MREERGEKNCINIRSQTKFIVLPWCFLMTRFYFGSNNKLFNMPRQKGRFQFRFFISLHHGKATRLPRGPHEREFEQEVNEGKEEEKGMR